LFLDFYYRATSLHIYFVKTDFLQNNLFTTFFDFLVKKGGGVLSQCFVLWLIFDSGRKEKTTQKMALTKFSFIYVFVEQMFKLC